jgi:hypothetical protein
MKNSDPTKILSNRESVKESQRALVLSAPGTSRPAQFRDCEHMNVCSVRFSSGRLFCFLIDLVVGVCVCMCVYVCACVSVLCGSRSKRRRRRRGGGGGGGGGGGVINS